MKQETIKVIIKEPGGAPCCCEIDNDLETLQTIVGGYIETYRIAEDVTIVCNEEGVCLGLPYNTKICGNEFVGPLIIAGVDDEEFCDVPNPKNVANLLFQDLVMTEIEVYQIADIEHCDYAFEDFRLAKEKLNINDYKKHIAYTFSTASDDKEMLEDIYTESNYSGLFYEEANIRSISMSDIIRLNDRYYYCDTIGWKDATDIIGGQIHDNT